MRVANIFENPKLKKIFEEVLNQKKVINIARAGQFIIWKLKKSHNCHIKIHIQNKTLLNQFEKEPNIFTSGTFIHGYTV